jgi:tellurite resistance protein
MRDIGKDGPERPITRIPPGFFGAALGLSGLAGLWSFAATSIGVSPVIGDAIALLAGAVWFALAAGYLRQGAQQILVDLRDTADGPMLAVPIMCALILGSVLSAHARTAGHVVVIASLIIGALLCGLLIGEWMTGGIDEDRLSPALYLPGGGIGSSDPRRHTRSDSTALPRCSSASACSPGYSPARLS